MAEIKCWSGCLYPCVGKMSLSSIEICLFIPSIGSMGCSISLIFGAKVGNGSGIEIFEESPSNLLKVRLFESSLLMLSLRDSFLS